MRLIDADALKVKVFTSSSKAMKAQAKTACVNMIDKAPTIEIVRCKDCKYGAIAYPLYCRNAKGLAAIENEKDFCSYGERSEE